MRKYVFSQTRIVDSILMREKTGQEKPVFSHILCNEIFNKTGPNLDHC